MLIPRSRLARFTVPIFLLNAAAIGLACAGSGDLDPTFGGGDGLAILSGSSFSRAPGLAIQRDGRIVAGGGIGNHFGLVRLLTDGTPDPTFGTNGIVITNFGGSEEIRGLAIQPDGRIVAVGSSVSTAGRRFAVARYTPDGTLDATFDTDGKVLTALPGRGGEATAVALETVGDAVRIVVAGTAFTGAALTDEDVAVVRYNADGSLDTTFNGSGQVVLLNFGRPEFPSSVAIQADGKIVVGGTADSGNGTFDFLLVRIEATGALDGTFGVPAGSGDYTSGGQVTTDFSDAFAPPIAADDVLGGIAIQPDGKIVAGGFAEDQETGAATFALARYEADGTLDPAFGAGGLARTPAGWGAALALRPDAKILLGGFAGLSRDFTLAQYDADGSLDATFGTGGVVTTNLGGFDAIQALALQADRKIVAAGTTAGVAGTQLAVARYLGGDTTPPTIDSAAVTPSSLWPPDHKLVPVTVAVTATDDGGAATCAVSGISSSEPVTGPDDETAPDWVITGPLAASLRAERANPRGGRTYTIAVECVDPAGNTATADLFVRVSRSPR